MESPLSPTSIPSKNTVFHSAEKEAIKNKTKYARSKRIEEEPDDDDLLRWPRKGRSGSAVMLEVYIDVAEGGEKGSKGGEEIMVGRTKSLTDDDLEELKGCLDLGFGFVYEEIPELCNTLPALELCYLMSQKFLDEQQQRHSVAVSGMAAAPSTPVANWKISSPGDHPDDVKARLRYWAQAVACTVRLCN